MNVGIKKEKGGKTLSRQLSQSALWKSGGRRVLGREDEMSRHLLEEGP